MSLANVQGLTNKGAEMKDLAAPLAKVWSGRMTMDNPEHQQVQAMLQHQCIAQRSMHDPKDMVFLPPHAAIQFAQAIDGMLVMWSLVSNASDVKGENVWNTPTKLHYLDHLGQTTKYLHPRRGNTMAEETYMGVCKNLAKYCMSSTDDHHMHKAFMYTNHWALHSTYL